MPASTPPNPFHGPAKRAVNRDVKAAQKGIPVKWHPKPRERTIKVPSCRTVKQPDHWVQTASGFVRAADHPVAIEARQGGDAASGSVHESAGLKGTGQRISA